MFTLFILLLGFVPLIWGANMLVNGCTSLAKNSKISNWAIGLTIVAFGTSTPEISVNVFAAFEHDNFIATGNILGSNIFNIGFILGLVFFLHPKIVKSDTLKIETIFAFIAAVVLLVVSKDHFFNHDQVNVISRSEGIIMLIFFAVFIIVLLISIKNSTSKEEESDFSRSKSIGYILMGIALLIAGGQLIVYSARSFADYFGITERIVALIIISVGTSLPEVVTTLVASRKGNFELVLGNLVGSNVFNVFFALGLSAIIHKISVWPSINLDIFIHILVSTLLLSFIITKNKLLIKVVGGVLVIIYLAYLFYLLFIM